MSRKQLLSAVLALASPLIVSAQVASAEFLGNVTSSNTQNIRDLGFAGTIGKVSINTYGDTLTCGDGKEPDRIAQKNCMVLHANSAAYSTDDPKFITDFNLDKNGNSQIFCGYFPHETPEMDYGMGITNVVPTSDTAGVLYFLKNHRPGGNNDIVGAGVAVVDVSGPFPTCKRTSE